jgi:putative protease
MKKRSDIEIMAPVGSYEALQAAIQAGAGSVYFGVGKLNMRARSSVNFGLADLKKITAICAEKGVKTYLTVNTVIYDAELKEVKKIIQAAKKNGITAIIASDVSVIQLCREAGMEVHLSTQCNVTNLDAVKYYANFADVIVLARELNLSQVAAICKAIKKQKITGPAGNLVKIEMFVHGALCMAVSGKCHLSLDNHQHSANRGACLQLCRRSYIVKDKETDLELEIDNEYIMSPKDLKTIHFLDKIILAGVSVLKIEGRGRSPEYVKTVVECYHEAVDAIASGSFTPEKVANWDARLAEVYNRGFWDGYYLGQKLGEWSAIYGSQATKKKLQLGKVVNFFTKLNVAEILLEQHSLSTGDDIMIIGPTTGVHEENVKEIRLDLEPVERVEKGVKISVPVSGLVRRGDKVYKVITTEPDLFQ